jgi:hypothetical protein
MWPSFACSTSSLRRADSASARGSSTEVIRFSRQVGYKKILLWTQSDLTSARKIYKAKGFKIIAEEGTSSSELRRPPRLGN